MDNILTPGNAHAATSGIRKAFECDGCELTKVDGPTVQLKRPTPTFEVFWHSTNPTEAIMTFHSKKHFDQVGEAGALVQCAPPQELI